MTVTEASIKHDVLSEVILSRGAGDSLVYNCPSATLKWLVSSRVSAFRGCEPVI